MNLLETLLNNGQTFAIAHNKGNVDIATKLVSLSVKKEDIVTVNFDLMLKVKDKDGKLEMSESFFNSVPMLENVGTGIREILHANTLYIYICSKDGVNDFSLKPVSLANKKGTKKSLTFKNDAIFAALQITKLIENSDDNTHYFSLNATEVPNLYKVEKAENLVKVSVPLEQILESQVTEKPTVSTVEENPNQINMFDDQLDQNPLVSVETEEDDIFSI